MQITQNNTTQKVVLVNSTADTLRKKLRIRERADRAWFGRLVQHPARKRRGSILSTPEPAQGRRTLHGSNRRAADIETSRKAVGDTNVGDVIGGNDDRSG